MKFKIPPILPSSPYRPFLRRFTDERAADIADTKALYARVHQQFISSRWADGTAAGDICRNVANQVSDLVTLPPEETARAFDECLGDLLRLETTFFSTQIVNEWNTLTLKEQVDLRRFLRAQEHFLANAAHVEEVFTTALTNIIAGIIQSLPSTNQLSPFSVPLYAVADIHDIIDRVIGTIGTARHADLGIFTDLSNQFYYNVCAASGIHPDREPTKPFIHACDSELQGTDLIEAYLQRTPFQKLFSTPIPFAIPHEKYVEHGAIFAPTGHGKTRLLEHIIVSFLNNGDPPAMFIMDSMGAMLKKIEKLDLFTTTLKDKLVILDPTDEKPPALNFFKLKGGSPAQQTALFFYLFKAIEQGLTQRQATMVAYLVELMQTIPNSTLDTLREVCESKTLNYSLDGLEPIARDFFTNQFMSKDALINQTKNQIAQRLYTVGRNQVFNRMFGATENKFDAFECMQQKKIVLINTDRLFLGDEASAIFGRFVIAQCLAAALARAAVPERHRHLALLIVDEAKAYLDDQAEKILSDARQFGLGMLLATQAPHQLPEGVQRELATNTTIKMVGPVSYSVASHLARDMHTSPEFIMSMGKHDYHYTEFATHVRGLTPHALKLQIPMDTLGNEPTMTAEAHGAIRLANRARYGAEPPAPKIPNPPAKAAERQPPLSKPIIPPPHKEVTVEQSQTSKKKSEQPQTSSPVTELDTDH